MHIINMLPTLYLPQTKLSIYKRLLSYIKSQKKDYCGIAPLKQDGLTLTEPQAKTEALNNFLAQFL